MLALLSCAPSVQAADAGSCRYVPLATLPLRGAANNSRPLVDGAINGKPAMMLMSTACWQKIALPGYKYCIVIRKPSHKLPFVQSAMPSQGAGVALGHKIVSQHRT
jgi:hypothetical protein